LMLNTSIDTVGVWNENTFTTFNYNNYVGYLYSQDTHVTQKNTTRTTSLSEKLSFGYRKDWLDVSLDGSLNYMRTRNLLQQSSNLDTWQFSYGANLNVYLPWNMSITTDLHENSRRGYDAGANTNELVWNAQVSQSFLKGNALSVSIQFYDILQNMSNFSRTVNAMQRSDTYYNNISSYAMIHVVYRFNLFGGRDAFNKDGRPKHPSDIPRGGFGGRPGMPPYGGFGGGRPPHMF
ncbi:outer membrane beta-barrel protein, partial [Prevotella pectinovora]|uniref:outer membrane beta-barrel protein n=1 Tax=Prevotella pectinovora TaxID=1602169 RepID=UPI0030797008